MPKILHTYRYTGLPWEILQSVVPDGFVIETLEEPTYECLLRQCADADYLLVSGRLPIDESVLSSATHLKMIQRTGVGTEMLDLEAIKRHSLPVYVNQGVNSRSVAEHTLTLILACLKRLTSIDRQVRKGVWKKQETGTSTRELYGKTIGLVGMGAIGRQVATYLNIFGAKVYYTDIFRQTDEVEKALGITFVPTFEALIPQVDILSFHCPLTDSNREMLNGKTISLMKPDAIVINTARGKLIDETALYESLENGRIAFAGLDVHYEEPMASDDPFKQLDNVILTPHIAGLSFETFRSMMSNAIGNISLFQKGDVQLLENKKLKI